MKTPSIVSSLGLALSILACTVSGFAWMRPPDGVDPSGPRVEEEEEPESHLGEKMNSIARRFAALWYANQYENWALVEYEIHEIGEILEDIEKMHPIENGVNVAGVLEGVYNSNFGALRKRLEDRDKSGFEADYRQTMEACNKCHAQTKHEFIHIKVPAEPPVHNRSWDRPAR
ncbi:MAG: hypothetical protein ACE5F1_06475 [Planctomycetota bacterium]